MLHAHFTTTLGNFTIRLFEEDAPKTVANFVGLAEGTMEFIDPKTRQKTTRPYYDGLTFHRVIDGFMIQGGCPLGTGTGGPGWTIKCETKGNPRTHEVGALSMAHAGKDTGGSQFFMVLSEDNTRHLNGVHTVFGKITTGLDVMKKIKQNDSMTTVRVA